MMWWYYLLLVLPILPNLWSLWHVRKHDFATEQEKHLWFVLGIFIPVFGGIIYFFWGRPRTLKAPLV